MYPVRRNGCILCLVTLVMCFVFTVYVDFGHQERSLDSMTLQLPLTTYSYSYTNNVPVNRSSLQCNECIHSPSSRYILSLNYWEQLNMALHNLYSLIRLVSVWQGMVVTPFTANSRLFGLPHLRANENWATNMSSLPLSNLLDINNLYRLSCDHGYQVLCDYNHFLSQANREVIILHFIFAKEAREVPVLTGMAGKLLKESLLVNTTFECSDNTNIKYIQHDILDSLNKEASFANLNKFKLFKYFCINGNSQTTPDHIADSTGLLANNRTIIILNWRGIQMRRPQSNALGDYKIKRQFIMLPNPLSTLPHKQIYYPSKTVLAVASQYVHDHLLADGYIGIHLRSEKMGQRGMRIPNYINECLQKVISLKSELEQSISGSKTIFVTDYGLYGSDSCRACKGSKETMAILKENDIIPVQFNPLQYGVSTDSGFVSLVEMNILLQSKILILVGGGSYQKQMIMRINDSALSERRHVERLFLACWDDNQHIKEMNTIPKHMFEEE